MNVELVPCPLCHGDIRADAKFCRHCGSSDSDGWREDFDDDLEDDDPEFDYDEFVADEFPDAVSGHYTNQTTKPLWRLVAVILLLLFLFGYAFF